MAFVCLDPQTQTLGMLFDFKLLRSIRTFYGNTFHFYVEVASLLLARRSSWIDRGGSIFVSFSLIGSCRF